MQHWRRVYHVQQDLRWLFWLPRQFWWMGLFCNFWRRFCQSKVSFIHLDFYLLRSYWKLVKLDFVGQKSKYLGNYFARLTKIGHDFRKKCVSKVEEVTITMPVLTTFENDFRWFLTLISRILALFKDPWLSLFIKQNNYLHLFLTKI